MNDDTRRIGPRESNLSDAPTGQIRAPGALTIEAAGRTDKGRVRPGNEDAFGLEPPTSSLARSYGTLLIVSDGMGGHAAGEVASNLAVETVQATYYRELGATTADAIRNAIDTANSAIYNSAEHDATRAGMGCTIVVMVVQGNTLTVGHVGDSRGYLIRGGRARQITRDHSWVAMQVEEGILTPEQAEHHPNRSLLMRALGRQPSVEVELGQHQLQTGDVLLLCSDGLTGVVDDAEIGDYASRYAPATAADQLVNLANQRGAPDNVTVLAAAITSTVGGAAAAASSAATTLIAPTPDAPTPRINSAVDDGATTPLPRNQVTASQATTNRLPAVGAPVVLSRESTPRAPAPAPRRRGRGRWLAGSLAAFGLAGGLVLLTMLGPRTVGDPEPARVAEAPAAKTFATPGAIGTTGPAPTVPPPLATGIPGLNPPGGAVAAIPPPPAATVQAPPQAAVSAPPAAPQVVATAGSAAATAVSGIPVKPGTTPLIPGIVAGVVATPTRPSGSPPALTAPTATPTPATRGADMPAPADADAPADVTGPSDQTATELEPDAGEQSMTDEGAGPEPSAAEPAPAPGTQTTSGSRLAPPSGVTLPGGIPLRPGRKPSDD